MKTIGLQKVALGIILLGIVLYFANDFNIARQKAVVNKPSSANIFNLPETKTSPVKKFENQYSQGNFSFSYPDGWILKEMHKDSDFPLVNRLDLFDHGVSVTKGGIYLAIVFDESQGGESGGIYVYESDYENDKANSDSLTIQGNTYLLSKEYSSISDLADAHSGPYAWGSLKEIIPVRSTAGGEYVGYDSLIKKNGNSYIVMTLGNSNGLTPTSLQQEIIDMLQTINW